MPIISDRDIYAAARAAGFSPDQAVTMTAIALAESGGSTSAHNPSGEDSRGLWQINVDAHPGIADQFDLLDPVDGARAAYAISAGGADIRPWTVTHGHGGPSAHGQFLGRARVAAEEYESRARLRRRAGAATVVALGALLVAQLWMGGQGDSVPAKLSAEAASDAPAAATGGPSPGTVDASATATPSRTSTPMPTPVPTPATTPTPTPATTPTPSPALTPATPPSPAAARTQQPSPLPTSRPVVPPPDIPAVRVTSVSSVCVRSWSAQVVALVTGEVVSVTALWSTMDGVEGGQAALAPDGAGWAGTLAGLPVDGSVVVRVKAQGPGGTAESESAEVRCAP